MGYRDTFEDENELWPVWRPILGTFLGMFGVFAFLAVNAAYDVHPSIDRALMLGRAIGAVIVPYCLVYWFALRRRGPTWKIGSFLFLLAISLSVMFSQVGREIGRMRSDLTTMHDDMSAAVDGKQLETGKGGNTLAGVTRNLVATLQADQRAFKAEVEATGVTALVSPDTINKRPGVLKDCGKIDALTDRVAFYKQQWLQRIATAREQFKTADMSEEMRRGALQGFDEGFERGRTGGERSFDLQALQMKEMASICRILARRHWQGTGMFLFTTQRDLDEYRTVSERYNGYFHEQERLDQERQARARASLNQMGQMLR